MLHSVCDSMLFGNVHSHTPHKKCRPMFNYRSQTCRTPRSVLSTKRQHLRSRVHWILPLKSCCVVLTIRRFVGQLHSQSVLLGLVCKRLCLENNRKRIINYITDSAGNRGCRVLCFSHSFRCLVNLAKQIQKRQKSSADCFSLTWLVPPVSPDHEHGETTTAIQTYTAKAPVSPDFRKTPAACRLYGKLSHGLRTVAWLLSMATSCCQTEAELLFWRKCSASLRFDNSLFISTWQSQQHCVLN